SLVRVGLYELSGSEFKLVYVQRRMNTVDNSAKPSAFRTSEMDDFVIAVYQRKPLSAENSNASASKTARKKSGKTEKKLFVSPLREKDKSLVAWEPGSPFGDQRTYSNPTISELDEKKYKHLGEDQGLPIGTPIYSCAAGKVFYIDLDRRAATPGGQVCT